jgi:hypothetical protein
MLPSKIEIPLGDAGISYLAEHFEDGPGETLLIEVATPDHQSQQGRVSGRDIAAG